jgi:hypothetical protein
MYATMHTIVEFINDGCFTKPIRKVMMSFSTVSKDSLIVVLRPV